MHSSVEPSGLRARVGHSISRHYLAVAVLLLLLQFALRVHHAAQFPYFIDESRHVQRAQLVYTLDANPIEFTHGKLLLYYWIGLFSPQGHSAVILGRFSIVVASLITAAATTAIARKLFGEIPSLLALTFYAFVPHAVFLERLALADPFASALATLSVWQLLRYLDAPTRRKAPGVGILISAAVAAKLTTALLMGLPVIAVMVFGREHVAPGSRQSVRQMSDALWDRYGDGLKVMGLMNLIPWLVLMALAVISLANGNQPILFPSRMIGVRLNTADAIRFRADVLYTIVDTLLSLPLAGALALAIPGLLWRAPRRTLFVLMWLAVLWAPSLILTRVPETRYLVIGYPALAVLVGALYWLAGEVARALAGWRGNRWNALAVRRGTQGAVTLGLALWLLGFAAPFAAKVSHAPETLELPRVEIGIFFQGPNGWAVSDALAHLAERGERSSERAPVFGRFHYSAADQDYCDLVALYVPATFDWDCEVVMTDSEGEAEEVASPAIWTDIELWMGKQRFVYLVMDRALPAPGPGAALDASQIFERQRPHNGSTVRVWRVDTSKG